MEPAEDESVELVKVGKVGAYITSLVPLLLDLTDSDIETLSAVLQSAEALQHLDQFVKEPEVRLLTVWKSTHSDRSAFTVRTDSQFNDNSSGVALIKREDGPLRNGTRSLQSQLRVLNLADAPLNALHGFINSSLAPFFRSYVEQAEKAKGESTAFHSVKQKISELELSLINATQNSQVLLPSLNT